MMIVVVILGVVMGIEARRGRLRQLAASHRGQAGDYIDAAPVSLKNLTRPGMVRVNMPERPGVTYFAEPEQPGVHYVSPPDEIGKYYRMTPRGEWHLRMSRRYEAAVSRPWLPVEVDPPPP